MRKLKLQMQMSIDGYVCGLNDELDWMTWNWDDELKEYVSNIHSNIDTILLGRKMTDGFIGHWKNVAEDSTAPDHAFGKLMYETPKVVFSRTIKETKWEHTVIAKDDVKTTVNQLKTQNGQDIIVYGGAEMVSSLIKENLIDEYFLFVNPTALGKGKGIFHELDQKMNFNLKEARGFTCGITLLHYLKTNS